MTVYTTRIALAGVDDALESESSGGFCCVCVWGGGDCGVRWDGASLDDLDKRLHFYHEEDRS